MTPARCASCGERVLVAMESGRSVVRDWDAGERPYQLHLCADPEQHEYIELTKDNLLLRCPRCESADVALSTWGRLVECPSSAWMSRLWEEQHQEHVCVQEGQSSSRARATNTMHPVDVPDL